MCEWIQNISVFQIKCLVCVNKSGAEDVSVCVCIDMVTGFVCLPSLPRCAIVLMTHITVSCDCVSSQLAVDTSPGIPLSLRVYVLHISRRDGEM